VSVSSQVRDVVAELAAGETSGFRASLVANRTDRPIAEIQRELAEMVERGDLDVGYELLCPDNGRLIARYSASDPLPIGETIQRDDCEEFDVTPRHLWVTYRPSSTLAMSLLRRATDAGKAQARRSRLRRALGRLRIGSTRTHFSGRTSTSTRQ
jgi:hypothetical protein